MFFQRLRTNPAGYIAMFAGSVAPIPVDIFLAQMTLGQSLLTRAWLIVLRTLLGGQYDCWRDKILDRLIGRWPKWLIDAALYSLFQSTGYALALIFVQVDFASGAKALTFVAITSFAGGPIFGLALDQIKSWIENWKRRFSRPLD